MFFQKLGIIGWDNIEATIVSALIAKKPVLLIGNPGTSKSEGCERISKAFKGSDCQFRTYDIPALNYEDLLGVLNPTQLTQGELDFVKTPLSVWGANSILLDEINCSNPMTQSKLHELIRTAKIMGLNTDIDFVWAAVNPPDKFQTNFLTVPLASRFVQVTIPSIKEMPSKNIADILSIDFSKQKTPIFAKKFEECRQTMPSKQQSKAIQRFCVELVNIITEYENVGKKFHSFEGRSIQNIYKILSAFYVAKDAFKTLHHDLDTISNTVIACIPEFHSTIRQMTPPDVNQFRIKLKDLANSLLNIDEATLFVESIDDLIKIETKDSLNWLQQFKQFIEEEETEKSIRKISRNLMSAKVDTTVIKSAYNILNSKYVDICINSNKAISSTLIKAGLQ